MTTPSPTLQDVLATISEISAATATLIQQVQAYAATGAAQLDQVQGQLAAASQNEIKLAADNATQATQIITLQKELAAAQHPTLQGASITKNAGEANKAVAFTRTTKAFGPMKLARLYDDAQGPISLTGQVKLLKPVLNGCTLLASTKFGIADFLAARLDTQVDPLLEALDGHMLAVWHEPDANGAPVSAKWWDQLTEQDRHHFTMGALDQMKDLGVIGATYTPRVSPVQHKALYTRLAQRIATLGVDVDLVLILTSWDLATRLPLYWDGVSKFVGLDPYTTSNTQTADQLVFPLLPVVAKTTSVPVIIAEIGQALAATKVQQQAFLPTLAALNGKVAGVTYFNYNANAGHQIDADADLSAALAKVIATV